MNLSDILNYELARRDLETLAERAKFLGLSTETVRTLLKGSRIPKDKNLIKIAERLGIDPSVLILIAHKHNIPRDMQSYFLKPAEVTTKNKRVWPLSFEQCEYLAKIMSPVEIQLIRKYRQLDSAEMIQTRGYIHYMFSTKRVSPPAAEQHSSPELEQRQTDSYGTAQADTN